MDISHVFNQLPKREARINCISTDASKNFLRACSIHILEIAQVLTLSG